MADQSRRAQYQQLVVRTFYLGNAKPSKAKEVISQALPASVGRPQPITVIDEDTNSLTVRDTAENVRLIGDLLEGIDKDRAEVVMDVDIYEVSRSSLLQIGNQLGNAGNNPTFSLGGYGGTAVPTGNVLNSTSGTGVNLGALIAGTPTAAAAALVIPPSVLTVFQSKNNSKLLASTQIHAFNNEESTARIGQRVPVQTAQAYPFGIQTGTPSPTTGNPFPSGGFPVINYEPTGLTLNFTPIVFPNLDVQVKMKISSKDVSGASTLTPVFTERELTGTARVQNNRTMMLASVSQDIQSTGRQGLPIISGLPLIGRLFSSPTRDNRNVDIVIAVTPRVLRAPAVTPRDLEMRQSGTLQAPTTGSLEAMMIETQREEMIAAARRLPKNPVIEVKDPAPTYEPAAKAEVASAPNQTTTTQGGTIPAASTANTTAPVNQVAATSSAPKPQAENVSTQAGTAKSTESLIVPADSAAPQPKPAAFTAQDVATSTNAKDVATALQSIVTAPSSVATTNLSAKQEAPVTATTDLAPKTNIFSEKAKDPESSLIELSLNSGSDDLKVGDKRQLAVQLKSDAPLGMALVTLRFDPKVLKISSIAPGSMFANAKTAPTLTQSIDEHGMVLISVTPAAGSAITADGTLLVIDVEAMAPGDTNLNFDLSNVHLVASDGRAVLLHIEPVKLTVN